MRLRRSGPNLRKLLLGATSSIARFREDRWRGVRFLCYHSVHQPQDLADPACRDPAISVAAFRRHLEVMQMHRYRIVSMHRALDLLAHGGARDGQYVCLTFDDGREDNFVNAWPLLHEAGYSAHFFVSSALVGKTLCHDGDGGARIERYMDHHMLREIVREGGSIGSHAHHHVDLTTLDDTRLRGELQDSRRLLEDFTGGVIDTHAYPWAVYNQRVLAATRDAGYRFAFTSSAGGTATALANGLHTDLTLPRNTIRSGVDAAENYITLRGGLDFSHPYSAIKMRLKYRT